jgi:signal transduction histidine kinase
LINASKKTLQASKKFCLNQLIKNGKEGCLNKIFAVELGTELKLCGDKEMSKTFFQIQITDQLIDGKV